MFLLDDIWKIELVKSGLRRADGGAGGGRVILLRATNNTEADTQPLVFTGKVKTDGIITKRFKKQFGVLLPEETEEIQLHKGTGSKGNPHAGEHVISVYFETAALEFRVTSMGCKFKGEIPTRSDMYTQSHLDRDLSFDPDGA
ncbi:MAG: hypothetical protein AAFX02_10795 [Pseudomonadota bacterium]